MTGRRGVGVGFVGAGSVLWAYLQTLDRLVPRGLAWEGPVCARRRSAWRRLSERRPTMHLVETPDEVFASDVDIVSIITSPSSHASLAIDALRHGKHVVVEKPLGLDVDSAEAVIDEANARGLHVMAAPFVQLSPTIRELWTRVADGEIGGVHAARASYGNLGAPWATWFREHEVGPLAEVGIYNLKTLTAILGSAIEVIAAESEGPPAPDRVRAPGESVHVLLRHATGAVSSITASHAMHRYRRPAIELYGSHGTANLLGDDWDPRGIELYRHDLGGWLTLDARDPTWLWTDGLRELVVALHEGRAPLADPNHDLHVIELLCVASTSARERRAVPVRSRPPRPDLRIDAADTVRHVHDHTRPPDEQ
jgi:predicted dehydrogenase